MTSYIPTQTTNSQLERYTDSELDEFDTQTVRIKPESLDNLVKLTKFNRRELKLMYRGFKQVSKLVVKVLHTFKNWRTNNN